MALRGGMRAWDWRQLGDAGEPPAAAEHGGAAAQGQRNPEGEAVRRRRPRAERPCQQWDSGDGRDPQRYARLPRLRPQGGGAVGGEERLGLRS